MVKFDEYIVEFKKYKEKEAKYHKLSGVVLICNNKILLVRPKKFKKKEKKWSIPKGHIEDDISKIKTAIIELREEAGIKITKKQINSSDKFVIEYEKSGVNKHLTCYVVDIEYGDINIKLVNDMILKNFLKNEIFEAGFFTKKSAEQLIEDNQLDILKILK